MVKGILKRYSRFANPRPVPPVEDHDVHRESPKPKRVSFDGAEPTKVFEADEWDRSPAAVTLKLTYRDVAELKELNVSLVNPSPLAMARTASRRPTKRTPVTTSPSAPNDSSISPVSDIQVSPGYQYHTFTSKSLTPLLEDASSSPLPSAVGCPRNADAPPGLPAVRTPMLRGLGSPALPPPSPLLLSPPLLRPSSPRRALSHTRPRGNRGTTLVELGTTEAPVSVVLPTLMQQQPFPVSQELKLEKLTLDSDEDNEDEEDADGASRKGQDLNNNAHYPGWVLEDADELERPLTPVVTRKPPKSLMGWEFKRHALGFGLVRSKPRAEETL